MFIPTTKQVTEARRRMEPLSRALVTGDLELFRVALFAKEPNVVSLGTANDLRFGFVDADEPDPQDEHISFAEACFYAGQVDMLRIALEARHPEKVGGFLSGRRKRG